MNTPSARCTPSCRFFFAFVALAAVCTIPFWVWPIDITLQNLFYSPALADAWPVASQGWVQFFYRAAPVLTTILGITSVGLILAGSFASSLRRFRLFGLFLFATLALGPGLLVNAVFKDHAGRPRPRQVHELGGQEAYEPPLLFNGGTGKSFPCGHCSVGFAYGAFAILLWSSRRRLAITILVASLVLGFAMGVGRMAAGGHFFSDVLWAGIFTYGAMGYLSLFVFRLRARAANPAAYPASRFFGPIAASVFSAVLVAILITGALAATPYQQMLAGSITPRAVGQVSLTLPHLPVHIIYRLTGSPLSYSASLTGFGFPGRHLAMLDEISSDLSTTHLRLSRVGLFTDLEGTLTLSINAPLVDQLTLTGATEVTTTDETSGAPLPVLIH